MRSGPTKRDRMAVLVERWQRSGEPLARFARRHGVGRQKLAYWCRVLGARGRRRHDGRAQVPSFVPVQVMGPELKEATVAVEITVADVRLAVREGTSGEWLRDVIAALRAAC